MHEERKEADGPRSASMRARVLAYDWAASPLGASATWPQSLKTAVDIMLSSRYAMWMLWGSELTFFCNDAYLPTLGLKQTWALGSRSDEVWREIWPDIGSRIARVLNGGEATWDEGLLLFLERSGFAEETYHTFSYSPLADDPGAVVGMLCVVTEETERVIGERRLRLLHDLGRRIAGARTTEAVWAAVQVSLDQSPRDVPWMLGYVVDHADRRAVLASARGIEGDGTPAPPSIDLRSPGPWPLDELLARQGYALLHDLPDAAGAERARSIWSPPSQALLVPVSTQDRERPEAVLILGLNPHRPLEGSYQEFIDLFVGQVSAGLAAAEAYEAERRRAELLAEVDRAKTTFFSNVSHEFRTPLTLMLGPLEDLLGRAASDDDRQLADIAHRNGLRLLRLVNGLLDFSRVEAGRTRASFRSTDLAALTADLASSFRAATDRAGLRLDVDCPSAVEPVFVDHEMWEKIVLNLLSNAFKFTFEGAITIELRQGDGFARLRVADTGTGIPPDQLATLFDRFKRVEGARGRSFEGSGIGLALVKELVALHGGSVAVESQVDRGSVFTVSIPLGSDHLPQDLIPSEQVAPISPAIAQTFVGEAMRWLPDEEPATGEATVRASDAGDPAMSGAGSRVLVADDNADLRDYIAGLLRSRGYRVDTAADGEEALQALRNEPPDLLVSDVMMPRLDGFGLLEAIRDDPDLRELPVLILSARAGEEAAVEGLDAGADDYLTKPFSGRELVARVASNIRLAKIRRDAAFRVIESEARFKIMADHVPVMLWMTDADGSCTYLNTAWYEFTGAEAAKDGLAWRDRMHPQDLERTEHAFQAASASRDVIRLEYRLRRADGAHRWVISVATPRAHADGTFLGYIGSTVDVTDLKDAESALTHRVQVEVAARTEAEDALRQAQKLEAVGQLTGGVAHDFNNLLTIIRSSVDLLKRPSLSEERRERYIDAISSTVDRASKLTSQLLAFARRQALRPEVFDVGRSVRSVVDMVGTLVGSRVDVILNLPERPCGIHADVGQFETALVNMAVNARDAMDGSGTLTVTVREVEELGAAVPGGEGLVAITLTDTGSGIAPEQLERIFEPFYTTKGVGKGTGLGLSQVFGFAKQSGGEVRVESEVGRGTSFTLFLPRAAADMVPEAGAEPEDDRDDETVCGIRVLLVEDNAEVGASSTQSLDEIGFRTRLVSDAREALRELAAARAAYDVVFTDVMMPGMNGADLGHEIRRLHPDLPVVLTSGYNSVLSQDGSHGFELLQKPYSVETVSRVLRRAVDKTRRDLRQIASV